MVVRARHNAHGLSYCGMRATIDSQTTGLLPYSLNRRSQYKKIKRLQNKYNISHVYLLTFGTDDTIIQGVSRLEDIIAGSDLLGLCDQKFSYKHVSDFGRLWSYGHF
jgi:hypothetical protein